ncbi:MAG TPA: hypothetical protein VFF30_04840 [Nitrososphaerales archaeon]|nr:hypothetical protein [Nitrososphaerales archaeon]
MISMDADLVSELLILGAILAISVLCTLYGASILGKLEPEQSPSDNK